MDVKFLSGRKKENSLPLNFLHNTYCIAIYFVVVCFPLWLLLSAANLLKLPESQKQVNGIGTPQ
jgi:hypothetical protein